MLASLQSLLPSSLQQSSSNTTSNVSPTSIVTDYDDDNKSHSDADPVPPNQKTKDKGGDKDKDKSLKANETFIFVRPPPAKSNHPLNLQVQLVPPSSSSGAYSGSRTTTPRQSLDEQSIVSTGTSTLPSSAGTDGAPLTRTDTGTTASSSTASFASYTSSTTSTSSRRMIIPLYNLQAHNVMANTIVDAGTDAKIVKFTKRGMELVNLALIEVVEVWALQGGTTTTTTTTTTSAPGSRIVTVPPPSAAVAAATAPGSAKPDLHGHFHLHPAAGSSALSLSSTGHSITSASDTYTYAYPVSAATVTSAPLSPPTPTPGGKRANIFGKLFNSSKAKKDVDEAAAAAAPTSTLHAHSRTVSQDAAGATPTKHTRNLSASIARVRDSLTLPAPPSPTTSTRRGGRSPSPLKLFSPSNNATKGQPSPVPTPGSASVNLNEEASEFGEHKDTSKERDKDKEAQQQPQNVLLPPTLGIQPLLSSLLPYVFPYTEKQGVYPPKMPRVGTAPPPRTPALYVWIVKKWLKPSFSPHSSGIGAELTGGLEKFVKGVFDKDKDKDKDRERDRERERGGGLEEVEMRIEWKKASKARGVRRRKMRGAVVKEQQGSADEGGSKPGSRRGSRLFPAQDAQLSASDPTRRLSAASFGSTTVSEDIHREVVEARAKVQAQAQAKELEKEKGRGRKSGSLGREEEGGRSVSPSRSTSRKGRGSLSRSRSRGRRRRSRSGTDDYGVDDGDGTDGEYEGGSDDGESDAEDSETPWNCVVKVRRVRKRGSVLGGKTKRFGGGDEGAGGAAGDRDRDSLRVKAGILSPTPHHPKVVAMLKVPFPLPDVDVAGLVARKRPAGTGSGFAHPAGVGSGYVLTAEDLKDAICCTGLWLAVREGFGGIGKVSRKGDGWRIRA